jgi:hypothetical protein
MYVSSTSIVVTHCEYFQHAHTQPMKYRCRPSPHLARMKTLIISPPYSRLPYQLLCGFAKGMVPEHLLYLCSNLRHAVPHQFHWAMSKLPASLMDIISTLCDNSLPLPTFKQSCRTSSCGPTASASPRRLPVCRPGTQQALSPEGPAHRPEARPPGGRHSGPVFPEDAQTHPGCGQSEEPL